MSKRFAAKGMTDDFSQCEHCGKKGLKRVVIMASLDPEGNATGDVQHWGTTCAARELGGNSRTKAAAERAVLEAIRKHETAECRKIFQTRCRLVDAWKIYVPADMSLSAVKRDMEARLNRHVQLHEWQAECVKIRREMLGV